MTEVQNYNVPIVLSVVLCRIQKERFGVPFLKLVEEFFLNIVLYCAYQEYQW